MKFICQKDDLMQGLSLAAKASAARSPQAVLECVSITADAAGVHLMCTDLQMGIETSVSATIAEEGRVLLNARMNADDIWAYCMEQGRSFNALTGEYADPTETLVVNPADTDIEVLRGATSIVGLFITSDQTLLTRPVAGAGLD